VSAIGFIQRWQRKAADSQDCFDRFFSAWIALAIASRRYLNAQQLAEPDTDRIAVIHYLEAHADEVVQILAKHPEQTGWLARRTGTGTGKPILDVHPYSPQGLRQTFDTLALVWVGKATRKPRWLACATAEMINHVRNNMFHGQKAPDDAADRDLLERVNPILLGLLNMHERQAK